MQDSLFLIGQVIHDLEQDCDYRLLWTSSTPDLPSYWLRLPGNSNVPEKVSLEVLSDGIEKGRYSFAPDIWRPVRSGEAGETALRLRDKAWDLIRDAVADEPAIYDPGKRRKILLGIEIIMEISCEESCCSAGNNQAAEQAGITQHSWQLSSR